MKKILVLGCMLVASTLGMAQTAAEYEGIMEKMIRSVRGLKTVEYTFLKTERYEGKMVASKQLVKMNQSPKKIYMNLLEGPSDGTEVWFTPSQNGGKARVSAGRFVPTISLSPFSSLMRDKQRNTIYELGFGYMGSMIYKNYKKLKAANPNYFSEGWVKMGGIVKFDDRDCYKMTMHDLKYGVKNYTVLKGESLRKIAKKLLLDEYSLIELNNKKSVTAGEVIKVPTAFAKEQLLYIDVKTLLPVYTKSSDNKGLVAEYSLLNVKVNPTFAADEFSEDGSMY